MAGFVVVMLAGFAGSFHCIGMCGGFVCALGPACGASPLGTVVRHLLYNLGRLVSYMFIGALAGLLGTALLGDGLGHRVGLSHEAMSLDIRSHDMGFFFAGELGLAQRLLSIVGGGFMIVMALQLFGLIRHLPAAWSALGKGFFTAALRSVLVSRSPAAPMVLGVLNGFLPCPLVFAFAALAAAAGTVHEGILTMAALGLGTFPAMLFMGTVGRVLAPAVRRSGVKLAGGFVLTIGLVTLVRGAAPALLHVGGSAI